MRNQYYIDITPLSMDVSKRGIGLYVSEFYNSIRNNMSNNLNINYISYEVQSILYNNQYTKIPFLGNHNERFQWLLNIISIPHYIKKKSVFHSTHPYTCIPDKNYLLIATVHDLIPLIFYDDYLKNKFINAKSSYKYYLNNLKRADHIIAISEQTKQDCIQYLGINEDRITTIHHGIDTNLFQHIQNEELLESIKKKHSLPSKFFLYVGGADFRKNVIRLVNAYGKIANSVEEDLVLVGQWYPEWISTLQNQLQSLGIQQRVHFLSFVETQDLACLYTLTTALLFPSLYEGFGLPVLEAFSCQTPVLCSNNSSLIEIANDCAVLVDPYQEEDIAQGILKITQDEKLRQELSVKGYSRSKDFSIDKMTKETIEVYNEIFGT